MGQATNAASPIYPLDFGTTAAGGSGAQAGKMIALYRAAGGGSFYGFGTNTNSTLEFHAGSATNGHPLMKLKAGVGLAINGGAGVATATFDVTGTAKISTSLTVPTAYLTNIQMYTTGTGSGDWTVECLGGARNYHFYLGGALKGYITNAGVYTVASDRALKTEEEPIAGALNRIRRLIPKLYRFKDTGGRGCGFIAQEVEEVFPEAVTQGCKAPNPKMQDHPMTLDISQIYTWNVRATQELADLVDELRVENQEMRGRLSRLESIVRNMALTQGAGPAESPIPDP
jgi:hypothetical protein